jgi:hypothetical protein
LRISCIHCKKDMELEITNVLRQRIEYKITELKDRNEKMRHETLCIPEWLENNEIRILTLEDLLK